MAHQIHRLAEKLLYNQPLLSTQQQVKDLDEYVTKRGDSVDISDKELSIVDNLEEKSKEGYFAEGDIAVLSIQGSLVYRATGWDALCGMTSYESLVSATRMAAEQGVKTLVLDVDSGGGQAYGTFESASEIRSIAQANDMKLVTYVDGMSASAAYALSIAADEVIINPMAEVGSIGVVTALRNTSERDKKEGIETTYVFAGDSKIPYDEDGKFTESFIDGLQTKVDVLYENFLDHVVAMRGIEKDVVRSTQAKVYTSQDALNLGLVDAVMTRQEFAEYLADISENGNDMNVKSLNLSVNEEKEKMQLEEAKEQLTSLTAEKEQLEAKLNDANSKLEEMNAQLTDVKAKNEEMVSFIEEMKQEQEAAKLSARKEKLSNVLAEDQVESVFEATKSLEDSAFETILSGYQAKNDQLESSDLFTEMGHDGEGTTDTDVRQSSVMSFIKQRKSK